MSSSLDKLVSNLPKELLKYTSEEFTGNKQSLMSRKVSIHTIQYNTIQYNTIQYNTIQYNTIQYNTIQYNTIQF